MGASEDAVFALSHFTIGVEGYSNIAKYDAVSGEQIESITYGADITTPDVSFAVDYDRDLIYLSSATLDTGLVYTKYIRRFDLDLVPDDSIMFSVTVDASQTIKFVSDLSFDDTNLYEVFSFEKNKYYMVTYFR